MTHVSTQTGCTTIETKEERQAQKPKCNPNEDKS